MTKALAALGERLREVHALRKASGLLDWDQRVCMPRGGGPARATQSALLKRLAHELFVADETERLLDRAAKEASRLDYDSDGAALVRWTRRELEAKRKLPASLVQALAEQGARTHEVWVEARKTSKFALFLPELEKMLALKVRQAEALKPAEYLYDAWLDEFEPGMKTRELARVLDEVKAGTAPLVKAVASSGRRPKPLPGSFDTAAQLAFCEQLARAIGFDFDRGRLDLAAHPFCAAFSTGDVRVTTRLHENLPLSAFFAALHEAGHGLYEQGIDPALEGTPLCEGASMGVHESQSRLWENVVGRSRGFWRRRYPQLRKAFPRLAKVPLDDFLFAANECKPSLIRVEADELTYGLHVVLRFGLERDLLAGKLKPRDLPQAWNAGMKALLGVDVPDDRRGVLQDVHWSEGLFGYFPTYVLGNVISLQLYPAAVKARPEIEADAKDGDFTALRSWLTKNVYRHGKKFTAPELVARACGGPISAAPYLRYLKDKYSALYGLKPA